MNEPRYPLAPLMAAAGVRSMQELRSIFPMNGAMYRRVLHEGLSEIQADRWAVRLGLLPGEVWVEWHEDAMVACAATDCPERFVPVQDHQRFCSSTCSSRQRRRDRFAADPRYRKARKAQARRYYEDHGEEIRERNREAKRLMRARRSSRAAA